MPSFSLHPKLNGDFGDNGIMGYAMLLLMIVIYAAAVGSAYD